MVSSNELLATLKADIEALKVTIQDAQKRGVTAETLNNVVELATLRLFSVLETFLQELFYLCMVGDASVPGSGSVVPVTTREQADLLLLSAGTRREKFLSWLPIERTLDLAEVYLDGNHPFERLRYRQTEKRALVELTTVRNAIAHPSDHARDEFVKLARSKGYPTRRAADYLLSTRAGNQEVLIVMTRVELVAAGLAADSDQKAGNFLEQEPPFLAQAKAPQGTFECVRCQNKVSQRVAGKLGACPACEPMAACNECGKLPTARTTWNRVSA